MSNPRKSNEYTVVEPTKEDNNGGEILEATSTISGLDLNSSMHTLQIRFFFKPILCAHCRDFIWGEGYLGYGCTKCGICVHSKCKIFLLGNKTDLQNEALKCKKENKVSLEAKTRANIYSVENWSIDIVKQWLAVVNLHRYAEIFATYKINGVKLLTLDICKTNYLLLFVFIIICIYYN